MRSSGFEAQNYQNTTTFINCIYGQIYHFSPHYVLHFVRCWALFIFSYLRLFNTLNFVVSGAASFPCVWADILFDKFWSCDGFFERLANVYDC